MKNLTIAILMAILPFFAQAQACDISSVQDGNWTSGSTWNTGQGLNCSINQQQLVICINHNVTINCANLDLRGGIEIHLNTPGVTLTINGNVQMRGTTFSGFASGTNIVINGNLDMRGNSEVDMDGIMHVTGNVNVDASAIFCGDGVLTADGSISGVCGGLLPVEITAFNVKANTSENVLSWETASETNNDFFTVERSYDGLEFETVDFITGAGNSSDSRLYSYNDKNFSRNSEWVYYRLKQTDFDGTFSYSNIISVEIADKMNTVNIFPNPAADFVNVSAEIGTDTEIQILNAFGQTVVRQQMKNQTETLNLKELSAGLYTIVITDGTVQRTERLVKN
jgi:hypothetical protein